MDITLATRKMNTCCKKRRIKRRSKKIKSRREEEANGENTSETRSEQEAMMNEISRAMDIVQTSCQKTKLYQTKEP